MPHHTSYQGYTTNPCQQHGNHIYVSTYFESFGHAHSRAQTLAWPVTLSTAGGIPVSPLHTFITHTWGGG